MVDNFFDFIQLTWAWIPSKFLIMASLLIGIYTANAVLGILDRGWRIIGR